jgi:alpha-L-rhamnosidase
VQPRPGGGITWARTEHVTPHGLAAVSWRLDDGYDPAGFELTVTVPPGCVAEVVLPDGTTYEAGPGVTTLG